MALEVEAWELEMTLAEFALDVELEVGAQALELVVVLAANRYESPAPSPQRGPAKWPSSP